LFQQKLKDTDDINYQLSGSMNDGWKMLNYTEVQLLINKSEFYLRVKLLEVVRARYAKEPWIIA